MSLKRKMERNHLKKEKKVFKRLADTYGFELVKKVWDKEMCPLKELESHILKEIA